MMGKCVVGIEKEGEGLREKKREGCRGGGRETEKERISENGHMKERYQLDERLEAPSYQDCLLTEHAWKNNVWY